jgi:predicted DNA-binding transcriptional regulator AlpA
VSEEGEVNMKEVLERLGADRKAILKDLAQNSRQMRYVSHRAMEHGYHAPTIAKLLGVAKRTVYLWTK